VKRGRGGKEGEKCKREGKGNTSHPSFPAVFRKRKEGGGGEEKSKKGEKGEGKRWRH